MQQKKESKKLRMPKKRLIKSHITLTARQMSLYRYECWTFMKEQKEDGDDWNSLLQAFAIYSERNEDIWETLEQASACNTDTIPTQPHRNSNTHRTKNNMTNVVIQQNSRKLLMMATLMSETCWAHKKWNKIASDMKLVFYSSTILFST